MKHPAPALTLWPWSAALRPFDAKYAGGAAAAAYILSRVRVVPA